MSRTTIGARPKADLVAQQQFRIGHQRAADGDHLLLAAGQRRARQLAALGEHREQLEDAPKRPRPGAPELAADQQILLDAQRRKQPPALRHQRDAARRHRISRQAADRRAIEHDRVGPRAQRAGDALEQRALAGAVGADHGDRLARRDLASTRRTAPGCRRRTRRDRARQASGGLRHRPRSRDRFRPPAGS